MFKIYQKKKSVFKELVIGCYDTGTAARDSSGSDPRRDTGRDQVPCAAQLEHQCSEGGSMRRRTRWRFSPSKTLLLVIVISSTGTSTLTSLPLVLTDQSHNQRNTQVQTPRWAPVFWNIPRSCLLNKRVSTREISVTTTHASTNAFIFLWTDCITTHSQTVLKTQTASELLLKRVPFFALAIKPRTHPKGDQ